jgi:hypothetical protein
MKFLLVVEKFVVICCSHSNVLLCKKLFVKKALNMKFNSKFKDILKQNLVWKAVCLFTQLIVMNSQRYS